MIYAARRYASAMHGLAPVQWVSDSSIRIELGSEISAETRARVYAAYHALRRLTLAGLLDITPAYTSILLTFDPLRLESPGDALAAVGDSLAGASEVSPPPPRTVEIPVCYDARFAPDLESVARLHGLAAAEVIALHAGAEYHVDFLGFSPGFPYLSGLPKELATSRLESPRTEVPAGSVAIAGGQAGIYPRATPGGWRLIGRTPLRLFEATRNPPSMVALGDRVRFVPITPDQFEAHR